MYTYIKSSCLVRSIGVHWANPDVKDQELEAVYRDTMKFYLIVHDSVTDSEIIVDMNAYRVQLATSTITVDQWLQSMDGKPLIAIPTLPEDDLAFARYENAILRGYKIYPVRAGYTTPENIPLEELVDLALTRPNTSTDITRLHTHCMMSVNGYFHRTDTDGRSAFILQGAVTAAKKPCSHTGILSFAEIGAVTIRPFLPADIFPIEDGKPLKDGFIIRTREEDIGKSPIFVMGGYIMQPDNQKLIQISETSWLMYPQAFPLVERYLESRDELDLSSMDVEVLDTNKEHSIVVDSLLSDENIRAWLNLSQSFISVIDTEELFSEEVNVRVSTLPGFVSSYVEPLYPLFMGYGKQVEYSKIKEVKYWALRIQDPFYKQFTFQKAPIRVQPVVTDSFLPWRPYARTQGYMLKFTAKKKTP